MKISCQSCDARYTIADEKILGKLVKITCKKCGAQIVVNGNDPTLFGDEAPAPASPAVAAAPAAPFAPALSGQDEEDDESTRVVGAGTMAALTGQVLWSVSVTDGASVNMNQPELLRGLASGEIPADAYVWKEGMGDWALLRDVPELARHLGAAAPPPPPPAPSRASVGKSTMFGLGGPAPQPSLSSPAAAPPAPNQGHVGERNENSVLFSLSALAGAGPAVQPSRPGAQTARASLDDLMGGGGPSVPVGGFGPTLLGPPPSFGAPVAPPPQAPLPAPPPPVFAGAATLVDPALGAPPAPFAPPPGASPLPMGGGTPQTFGGPVAPSAAVGSPFGAAPAPAGSPFGAPPPAYGTPSPLAAGLEPSLGVFTSEPAPKKSKLPLFLGVGAVLVAAAAGAVFALDPFGLRAKPQDSKAAEVVAAGAEKAAEPAPAASAAEAPAAPAVTEAAAAAAAPAADPAAAPVAGAPGTPGGSAVVGGSGTPGAAPVGGGAAVGAAATPEAPKPAAPPPPVAEKTPEPPPPPPPPPPEPAGAAFNAGEAKAAMGAAAGAAKSCKKDGGPTGSGKVKLTFAPSGRATNVAVDGPPFAGTPVGSCIAGIFRGVKVSPFSGDPVTVNKTVVIQ